MPVIKIVQYTENKHSLYFNVTDQSLWTEYLEQLLCKLHNYKYQIQRPVLFSYV